MEIDWPARLAGPDFGRQLGKVALKDRCERNYGYAVFTNNAAAHNRPR